MSLPSYFPLRWESTRQQWWYASPIDLAASNGHYDLVIELLHLDTNLLIKLTSLQRIRRLETLWDDDQSQFHGVAKCRSHVARKLMLECETGKRNSLVKAGYGGWLLYTAASAGDVGFVTELLRREASLVFGEGEYGVTDILYAAARSKDCEVFKIVFDYAMLKNSGREFDLDEVFKTDMVNRAVHAAARGGNWEILNQFIESVHDILAYRDSHGCTVLHSAAATGQAEVVRKLLESFDIVDLTDDHGNTALHVACYRGYLPVVEILVDASPSLALLVNYHGDTLLHLAVAGFKSPGFCRLDKHFELVKKLVSEKIVKTRDIVNVKNNDGRTALHVSVIDNIQVEVVELLMSLPSIDLNICDVDGLTPLDLLKQRSRSKSSDFLIKRLISAGGINREVMSNNSESRCTEQPLQKIQISVNGASPGTLFRIPDAEIFLYTGIENASDANYVETSPESYSCSSELSNNSDGANSPYNHKSSSVNNAARRLKFLLRWRRRKDRKDRKAAFSDLEDDDSLDPFSSSRNLDDFSVPLRQRYSQSCSLRTHSIRSFLPSPSSKMNFATGLIQGVIQLNPHVTLPPHSTPNLFQELSVVSLSSINKQKNLDIIGPSCSNRSIKDNSTLQLNYKQDSFNKKLMNPYLSFGAQGLMNIQDSNSCESNRSYKRFSSLVA